MTAAEALCPAWRSADHDCPVINTPFTYEGGREGFRRLLEQEGTCPKALFCVSDLVCAGVPDCAEIILGRCRGGRGSQALTI